MRTIADTLVFYYAFAYSKPYTPLIPKDGSDHDLEFPGGPTDPRNKALIEYRDKLKEFIVDYTAAQHPPGYEFDQSRTEAVAAVATQYRNVTAFASRLSDPRRHSTAGRLSSASNRSGPREPTLRLAFNASGPRSVKRSTLERGTPRLEAPDRPMLDLPTPRVAANRHNLKE